MPLINQAQAYVCLARAVRVGATGAVFRAAERELSTALKHDVAGGRYSTEIEVSDRVYEFLLHHRPCTRSR